MNAKIRKEPFELKGLRYLKSRMKLSSEEIHYLNLAKGFKGELQFDKFVENYSKKWLVLNDLLLEVNHSLFQIDTLIIFHDVFYVFDVKNSEEDFYIDGEKWYKIEKKDAKNPLHQLQRCDTLFRRLLHELGFHTPIKSYVSFINPEFFLYNAPMNPSMIFLPQLKRFMEKLSEKPVKLQKKHFDLAERLISLHIEMYPNSKLPAYSYDQLEKGPTCGKCGMIVTDGSEKIACCRHCGHMESLQAALLRNVEEYAFLFPDRKITTNNIFDWSGGFFSKKSIRKVLSENFTSVGHGKYRFFQ